MQQKRIEKRTASHKPLQHIHQLQKEFSKMPAKLSLNINESLKELKQENQKIKKSIHKMKVHLKNAENRLKTTAKTKNTTAGKKQFKVAKKLHGETNKQHNALLKQLKDNIKMLETAQSQQSKLSALRKHLSQFEKDWVKESKKPKAKNKALATKSKKKREKVVHQPKDIKETFDFEPNREDIEATETETVS